MWITKSASTTLCTASTEVPLAPMHFIVMDLIGKFRSPSQGHQYAIKFIDMQTNYALCIPLSTNKADEVVHGYLISILLFDGSHKILSDNGTEFPNNLFAKVASITGIKQIHRSPYFP